MPKQIASDQHSPEEPEKKKTKKRSPKKKTSTPPPVPLKKRIERVEIGSGTYEVGSEYQVLHYSSLRWETLELKRIEEDAEGVLTFSFFSNPPGWMVVREDRVKQIPMKTKGRKRKSVVED